MKTYYVETLHDAIVVNQKLDGESLITDNVYESDAKWWDNLIIVRKDGK